MRLTTPAGAHLTYCTNIHPGDTWSATYRNLRNYVPAIKSCLAPDQAFGIGLRLSGEAAAELQDRKELESFRTFLEEQDLYVFTLNGFAYGQFHGRRVKQDVYLPDWMDDERLAYSNRLA